VRTAYDVASPRQAHEALNSLWHGEIKPLTRKGVRGRIIWETCSPTLRESMRKMFHGPVLNDFATQVWLPDPVLPGRRIRYAPTAWKVLLKEMFCPAQPNGNRSTEALGDDEYAEFLTAVQAFGVVDLGVVFTERDA